MENEPAVAELVARTLRDHGYVVDVAADGNEVVSRSNLGEYDLILLDMKMPGLDDKDMYNYMSGLPGDVTSKVVFITGDIVSTATREFTERVGNPVLTKPFTLEQLLDTVGRLIDSSDASSIS